MHKQVYHILVVEDHVADRKLLSHLFKACTTEHELHFAKDGEEALDFLYHRGPFKTVPNPDLVLLDLNMPKKDGREVLKEVKSDPQLKKTPIVVLTTSSNEQDVAKVYEFNANSCIQKPRDLKKFQEIIKTLEQYWLNTVELPGQKAVLA